MKRVEVFYSGNVQGVWFRGTTEKIAMDFAVTGFVENLQDGRVHLIAEGDAVELERFLDAVQDAKRPNISDIEASWSESLGEFEDFTIRR